MSSLKYEIIETIKTCFDPDIPVNIYDLGLIYKCEVDEKGVVDIDMTLTSPNCPSIEELPDEVQKKVSNVEGVEKINFNLVWEPPFTQAMMSDEARLALGLL